jgi:hypothetical protein
MDIRIVPITQYNSFVKEPSGNYCIETCIVSNGYNPIYNFEEKEIDAVIEKMVQLLQYFKGKHTVSVSKLVWCEPYKRKNMFKGKEETRNWKVISGKMVRVSVENPQPAKVIASSGSSFGDRGWFLKAEFGINGVNNHNFGVICQSYKSAKEYWGHIQKRDEEIAHWSFEEIRKKRKVKCNGCGKSIENLIAQQCSDCGRYFCDECMTSSTCSDCQMKGEE